MRPTPVTSGTASDRWRVSAQSIALALVWGASFLFIAIGLEGLSPTQVVLGRLVTGAVALLVISAIRKQSPPRELAVWLHLSVVALLLCVIPFLLFAWAQQHISSGLASIYNATTPLMTALVAILALRQERLSATRALGLIVGFVGVVVVLGPWGISADASLLAQGACLLATLSYGVAFVYLRRFISPRKLPALSLATVQVGIGAVVMITLTPFIAMQPVALSPRVLLSVVLLGALGTGMAYVWNTNIVAAWGATNASTVTYLTPLVGVTLGVIILSESVGWNEPLGALVVIVGIALSQGRLGMLRQKSRSLA